MKDRDKSIEQLENKVWTETSFPTPLVEKCFHFRKIPVDDLTTEQMRLLIGQNIGLPFLIPKTLEILSANILTEGDLYPGDLLSAVLTVPDEFWNEHDQLRNNLIQLITMGQAGIERNNYANEHRQLLKKIDTFKSRWMI